MRDRVALRWSVSLSNRCNIAALLLRWVAIVPVLMMICFWEDASYE
jgi:hypothetical protein